MIDSKIHFLQLGARKGLKGLKWIFTKRLFQIIFIFVISLLIFMKIRWKKIDGDKFREWCIVGLAILGIGGLAGLSLYQKSINENLIKEPAFLIALATIFYAGFTLLLVQAMYDQNKTTQKHTSLMRIPVIETGLSSGNYKPKSPFSTIDKYDLYLKNINKEFMAQDINVVLYINYQNKLTLLKSYKLPFLEPKESATKNLGNIFTEFFGKKDLLKKKERYVRFSSDGSSFSPCSKRESDASLLTQILPKKAIKFKLEIRIKCKSDIGNEYNQKTETLKLEWSTYRDTFGQEFSHVGLFNEREEWKISKIKPIFGKV